MKTFSIKEALKRGWELFKGHKGLLLFSTLIILGINGAQSAHTHDSRMNGFSSHGLFFGLLVFVVVNMLHIGWTKMLLKISDNEETSLGEMIKHANLFIKFMGVVILYGIIVGVGMLLLIIPGIYFGIKYMFAPIIAIDEYQSIKETFKESARITQGLKLRLLGFSIVLALINVLGAVALLVGLLVSVPLTMLAYIYTYRKLLESSGKNMSENVPNSHTEATVSA